MRDAETKLYRAANRKASNEAGLFWALFGSALSLGLIVLDPILLFIGFGLPMWVTISFLLAGFAAYIWYLKADRTIRKAQMDYNDIMKTKKAEVREAHLEALRKRNE